MSGADGTQKSSLLIGEISKEKRRHIEGVAAEEITDGQIESTQSYRRNRDDQLGQGCRDRHQRGPDKGRRDAAFFCDPPSRPG